MEIEIEKQKWYALATEDVLKVLQTNSQGLTNEEASLRLELYGPNRLPEPKRVTLFQIFFRQFESPLIYILLIAAIVMFFMGGIVDG